MGRGTVAFDDFELDHDRFELRHRGTPVPVERQVFDVLAYLVGQRGRVVPKEELLEQVWGTTFVTESALTTQVKFARRVLGDSGTAQRYIRTVHRRGYEFVGPVEEPAPGQAGTRWEAAAPPLPRPSRVDRLVGREAAAAELSELVLHHSLVTLLGPGGVGKSRLAGVVAGELSPRFADGHVVVDLAPVEDARDLPRVVAEGAGLGLRDGVAVADALARLDALVVLDNCEHVLDAVAGFADRVLAGPEAPVRLLATTRERLGLEGEVVLRLPPLSTRSPDGGASAAARLFLLRAGGDAAGTDLADVEDVVGLVDGLPLAVELAAAQLGVMSVPELRDRLRTHRVHLAGERRVGGRHESLATSVLSSWELLSAEDRRTLAELGVLPGAWNLDTAEGIASAADPIASLRRLEAKSLVATRPSSRGTRFELLFGVRDFVRRQDGVLPGGPGPVRERLVRWFADWLDEWGFEEQWASSEFLDVLVAERALVREVARVRDVDLQPYVGRVVGAAAASFRYGLGVGTGRTAVDDVPLELVDPATAARLRLAGSEVAYAHGDVERTHRLAEEAEGIALRAGRTDLAAVALLQQCVGRMLTDPSRSAGLLERAAGLAVEAGAPRIRAAALALGGFCDLGAGASPSEVLVAARRADELAAPFGWDRVCVRTLQGSALVLAGDGPGAAGSFRAISEAARTADLPAAAAVYALLALMCDVGAADDEEVRRAIETFLREYRRATGRPGTPDALLVLAHRAASAGREGDAMRLLRSVEGHRLAHQVGMLLGRTLGARLGVPPPAAGRPAAAGPPMPPTPAAELVALLEQELRTL